MADLPDRDRDGADGGGYEVPPQMPAPPDVRTSGRGGPPQAPPDDVAASLWGPAAVPSQEPGRWGARPYGTSGTALLDRPTVARRPIVAPPVAPAPLPADQSWDWERSHRLRNALVVAAAILLIGSLMAAFVVFRNREDTKKPSFVEPPPATLPTEISPQQLPPPSSTVPSIVPVPAPATTAVTVPAAPAPPPPTAPPAPATTVTTRRVTPTVTASPPHPSCPPACPTTAPRPSTTSTTRPPAG